MMRRLLLAVVLSLLAPFGAAHAAAIAHCFVQQNTQQTTTSATMGDVTGAVIDDTTCPLVAGKKYLLSITFQTTSGTGSAPVEVDIVHGSTSFLANVIEHRPGAELWLASHWFTVWTAVTGEDIKLRFRSANGVATARIDQIAMFAMNLSDNLVENTDWFFGEHGNADALSTTPVDGASITFTPSGASNWLVLARPNIDLGSQNTSQVISRLVRSGEAASSDPEWRVEQKSTASERFAYTISRVFALTAVSNTFKEQSEATATVGTRVYSAIFALNLNKFKNHAFAYTAADTAASQTDYATQAQTISITPDVISNVWIGGFFGCDMNSSAVECEFRLQVDNADQPTDQTANNYQFEFGSNDALDEPPVAITTMVTNMSAAAHTIDLDMSTDVATGTPAAQYRSLWAVTMELAAAGGSKLGLMGVGR